jgi:hypothetical protein
MNTKTPGRVHSRCRTAYILPAAAQRTLCYRKPITWRKALEEVLHQLIVVALAQNVQHKGIAHLEGQHVSPSAQSSAKHCGG